MPGIKLVLLRHGESIWNRENKFTGWTDIDLSDKGCKEAEVAGKILKDNGYMFDVAYTSVLKRAIRTLWIVLDIMDLMWIPVYRSWRLNERHYGALQGLNKNEIAKKYGEQQVLLWRRSYNTFPPRLKKSDPRYSGKDPRYKELTKSELPVSESLESTIKRFLPYWEKKIIPEIRAGKKILIAAHGNSLRALVKHLDHMSETEIIQLNIPTGIPLVYELDKNLSPIRHYYIGDQDKIQKTADAVARQGKK